MKKVLIIESDATVRKLAGETLRKEGYEVVEAGDGQRGLKEIRETTGLGAILLANDLTGLTGMDTLIAIRKFRASLPVIMLMDKETAEVKMQAVRRGATDLLGKPVKGEDLLVAVNRSMLTSRLSGRLDRQIRRLQQLEKGSLELTAMTLTDLAPEEVLRESVFIKKTIDLIGEVLEAKKVSLMLVYPDRQELVMAHSNWMTAEQMASIRQPIATGVAGWVAREGKPLLLRDVARDERFARAARRTQYQSPSFVCTPLFFKRKVVGTISANDRVDGEPFSESDLSVLNTFAHQVSMTIASISTHRKLQREHEKLSAVHEMVNAVLASIEPQEIFNGLTTHARDLLAADAAAILTLSEENTLVVEACAGPEPIEESRAKKLAAGALARVLAGEPLLVVDATKTRGVDPARDFPPGVPPRSLAAVPLKVKNKVLGVLAVYNHIDGRPLGPWDLEVLEAVAPQASMAIKNSWLYQNLLKSIDEVVAANTRLEAARVELQEKAIEITALKKRVSP